MNLPSYDPMDEPEICEYCGQTEESCICHDGDECGRWNNGELMDWCTKAGSEECDFECPYRDMA